MVQGELVTVTFFLKDIPDEMTFNRKSSPIGSAECAWELYIDTDNDLTTGTSEDFELVYAGSDYSLSAMNIFFDGEQEVMLPVEKGVEVDVWIDNADNTISTVSKGTIKVDPNENTMTISGNIPGVSTRSLFYYKIYGVDPNGQYEFSEGQIVDRITFIE